MVEGLEGSWPGTRNCGPFRRRKASYCRLLANPDLADEILFHGWSVVVVVVAQQVVALRHLSLESWGGVSELLAWLVGGPALRVTFQRTRELGWIDNPLRGRREMTWKREFIWDWA